MDAIVPEFEPGTGRERNDVFVWFFFNFFQDKTKIVKLIENLEHEDQRFK